jgi:hypothetical protein
MQDATITASSIEDGYCPGREFIALTADDCKPYREDQHFLALNNRGRESIKSMWDSSAGL